MRKFLFLLFLLLIVGSVFYTSNGNVYKLPYSKSQFIKGISWAEPSEIVRKAKGSDNWPVTWADNGKLYTAFGDGWGFEPKSEKKLSLGFAWVEGGPKNFKGRNIYSPDQQYGNGESGKKACGMLMVDGVLYMWVRNADENGKQAQLAWSKDRGRNWTWADWKFNQFGYPTFINFGKNYTGARDDYVYTVTHDNSSAYETADQFVLMRVPKEKMQNRDAYTFFKEMDAGGNPVWTKDIAERGAVFKDPRRCFRSGISYNQGLGRYFWWQAKFPEGEDGRWAKSFAVFEAPEPWGPWATVFYTDDWDVGVGEAGSFPPKWISSDGKTMHLVFSGNDAFSVRKCKLKVDKAN